MPIFVYIQLSDLPLQFMSPYSDVVGIASLLLMLVGVFTGTFVLLKNLGEVAPSHT